MPYLHVPGVKVKARFSKCKKYRYWLDVRKQEGDRSLQTDLSPSSKSKTACVIMMNPSMANEEIADKSVQFMEKIVLERGLRHFKGVRRLIVVNQFAYIQTNEFKGLPHEIGPRNNAAIKAAFKESDIIILGWGCGNKFKARQDFVLGLLPELKGKRFFQTKKHPSRAAYKGFIKKFKRGMTNE